MLSPVPRVGHVAQTHGEIQLGRRRHLGLRLGPQGRHEPRAPEFRLSHVGEWRYAVVRIAVPNPPRVQILRRLEVRLEDAETVDALSLVLVHLGVVLLELLEEKHRVGVLEIAHSSGGLGKLVLWLGPDGESGSQLESQDHHRHSASQSPRLCHRRHRRDRRVNCISPAWHTRCGDGIRVKRISVGLRTPSTRRAPVKAGLDREVYTVLVSSHLGCR